MFLIPTAANNPSKANLLHLHCYTFAPQNIRPRMKKLLAISVSLPAIIIDGTRKILPQEKFAKVSKLIY